MFWLLGAAGLLAAGKYSNDKVKELNFQLQKMNDAEKNYIKLLESGSFETNEHIIELEKCFVFASAKFNECKFHLTSESRNSLTIDLQKMGERIAKYKAFEKESSFVIEYESSLSFLVEKMNSPLPAIITVNYIDAIDAKLSFLIKNKVKYLSLNVSNLISVDVIDEIIENGIKLKNSVQKAKQSWSSNDKASQTNMHKISANKKTWWSFLDCESEPTTFEMYEQLYKKKRLQMKRDGEDITLLNAKYEENKKRFK